MTKYALADLKKALEWLGDAEEAKVFAHPVHGDLYFCSEKRTATVHPAGSEKPPEGSQTQGL